MKQFLSFLASYANFSQQVQPARRNDTERDHSAMLAPVPAAVHFTGVLFSAFALAVRCPLRRHTLLSSTHRRRRYLSSCSDAVTSARVVTAGPRRMCGGAEGQAAAGRQRLLVTWSNGSEDQYPLAWLRDMCRCAQCSHSSVAASRLLPFREISASVSPIGPAPVLTGVDRASDGSAIICRWADGHTSVFGVEWLRGSGSLREEARRRRRNDALLLGPHRVAWSDEGHLTLGSRFAIPVGNYDEIMHNDVSWCEFLRHFRRSGVYLIKAAATPGLCKELVSRRQLVVRGTCYGSLWTVDVRAEPHDLAFTNAPLEPHGDLLFYSRPPEVIWFHCLTQAAVGGETILCDGLAAANRLKQVSPVAFDALVRIPVDHWAVGEDTKGYGSYRLANRAPVIRLDELGDVYEVLWNSTHRSYSSCASADDLEEWYEAAAAFHSILDGPAYKISHRLQPGDLLVVDNLRVLHGRSAFSLSCDNVDVSSNCSKPTQVPSRLIEGFYTDWDDMLSSYRALTHQLAAHA